MIFSLGFLFLTTTFGSLPYPSYGSKSSEKVTISSSPQTEDQHYCLANQRRCVKGSDEKIDMAAKQDENSASQTPALPKHYFKSPLARAVYYKMREDEENKNNRHVYWYRVIVSRLKPELQPKFIQFEQDTGTDEFLENCTELSNQVFTQFYHSLAKTILNLFMTQTSVNGFLNRGSMFIFSKQQIEKFLNISSYQKWDNLLDLGAGDGKVTSVLSLYFRTTYVTEMSSVMLRRLRSQGFRDLGVNEWQSGERKYDLIACLNLLDRCDKPMTLLSDIRSSLVDGTGRVLVAVVIPFKPYVEYESKTHEPSEVIRIVGSNFEEEIEQFDKVFSQAGFEIEAFTRLPYLCEGDLSHSFYVLNDAVFLLKVKDNQRT